MKPFVIDIETSARPDADQFIKEPEAPSNYKDAAKIEAYINEKRLKLLEEAALSAETARVLCVGILRDTQYNLECHDDEKDLLHMTWQILEGRKDDEVFVTFNGAKFDFPMLVRRSYALGVSVPSWMQDKAWRFGPDYHVDLFQLWQAGDRTASISLDRLAKLCGLPEKLGSGADFAQKWTEDRAAAMEYVKRDLDITLALYQRMMSI